METSTDTGGMCGIRGIELIYLVMGSAGSQDRVSFSQRFLNLNDIADAERSNNIQNSPFIAEAVFASYQVYYLCLKGREFASQSEIIPLHTFHFRFVHLFLKFNKDYLAARKSLTGCPFS